MPEIRTHSGIFRCWRLRALVTGITLLGGSAAARSTPERWHDQVCGVRRLRQRFSARRGEIDRQRHELAPVATMGAPASSRGDEAASDTHAIATLACVGQHVAGAGDILATQTIVVRTRTQDVRAVPTLWPVRGAITSPFGWRRSPYGGELEWHPGIDIGAPYGTPVRATAPGDVVFAGHEHGYGILVVLDHGATTTRYAHLATIWVRAGQRVLRGEPLGVVGGTGRATAAHLHYEVRFGSEALDPGCFLSGSTPTAFTDGQRRSDTCGLVRARLEGPRSPTTARNAARPAASRTGVPS